MLCLPGTASAFLFVSFCVLRTWLGNHEVGGSPKYGWTETWVVVLLQLGFH